MIICICNAADSAWEENQILLQLWEMGVEATGGSHYVNGAGGLVSECICPARGFTPDEEKLVSEARRRAGLPALD